MGSLFPIRDSVSVDEERDPRLVDLDEDTADEVFEALSSSTTREIFLELHEQPQAASDLAETTETSVQNVQYHLEKLTEAELIEVVDTWYSERGSEMKVYAPTDESLVLYAGRDKQSSLRTALRRLVGAFGALVPASLAVGWFAGRAGDDGPDSVDPTTSLSGTPTAPDEEEDDSQPAADETDSDDSGEIGTESDEAISTEDQSDAPEDEVSDTDTINIDELETAEFELSGEDVALRAGEESVNTTAGIEFSANRTVLALDPADVAALTADSGAEPGLVGGLAFFLGGLFVLALVAAWSTWG